MRGLAQAAWMLSLAAGVGGCGVVASIRPLYTETDLQTPIVDARIEGDWIGAPDDVAREDAPSAHWRVTAPEGPSKGDSAYSIEIRNEDDAVQVFDGRLVTIGGTLFFDAEFRAEREGRGVVRDANPPWLVPTHVVGRIWVQQDLLRIAPLNSDWVKEHVTPGAWVSYPDRFEDHLLFTGSTEELRTSLADYAGDLEPFAGGLYLCRRGTDCALRATEDMLARAPDDGEVLESAARVFAARGNYVRALALRQHRADLTPDDAWLRAQLGYACLANREFQRARVEFAAAIRTAPAAQGLQVVSSVLPFSSGNAETITNYAALGVPWTYFLEGRYAEAVKAAGDYHPSSRHAASAQPILLKYFSLIRLGRRKDAETGLRREVGRFDGPSREHLLLLDAQGRTTDDVRASNDGEIREREFFLALREIAAGHLDRATRRLTFVAGTRDHGVIALAAAIELERLGRRPNGP